MSAKRYVIKFSFEGTSFEGYARQPTGRTVEGELLGALQRAELTRGPEEAAFASASRVDRGVSALGAAAAFDTEAPMGRVLRSLNAQTGHLVAHSVAEVETGFDPRRRAASRWYRYHYLDVGQRTGMVVSKMEEAAALFVGEHDFSGFARLDGRDPVREVTGIALEPNDGHLALDVTGQSFLWNQVRRMASAISMVGSGDASVADVREALVSGVGDSFRPLPPEGLFLMDVEFPQLEFSKAEAYPRGTVDSVKGRTFLARCQQCYLEDLRELMGL